VGIKSAVYMLLELAYTKTATAVDLGFYTPGWPEASKETSLLQLRSGFSLLRSLFFFASPKKNEKKSLPLMLFAPWSRPVSFC